MCSPNAQKMAERVLHSQPLAQRNLTRSLEITMRLPTATDGEHTRQPTQTKAIKVRYNNECARRSKAHAGDWDGRRPFTHPAAWRATGAPAKLKRLRLPLMPLIESLFARMSIARPPSRRRFCRPIIGKREPIPGIANPFNVIQMTKKLGSSSG